MAKRYSTTDLMEKMISIDVKLDRIESKIDAINSVAVKGSKEVAKNTVKSGKAKATKGKSSSGNFDRKLYEATAKKLGVWNEEYGKVTGTWKDGKKVADAKTNRAKVYEAMGI